LQGFAWGYAIVAFDHDADGTAGADVTVTNTGDMFVYDPRASDSTLIGYTSTG